jgi:hypothetical protein
MIRLWRARKDHAWIDARLEDEHAGGASLEFFYDGDRIFVRRLETRQLAVDEAHARLQDLLRAGWVTHW